jgi:hypothetical protein
MTALPPIAALFTALSQIGQPTPLPSVVERGVAPMHGPGHRHSKPAKCAYCNDSGAMGSGAMCRHCDA